MLVQISGRRLTLESEIGCEDRDERAVDSVGLQGRRCLLTEIDTDSDGDAALADDCIGLFLNAHLNEPRYAQ